MNSISSNLNIKNNTQLLENLMLKRITSLFERSPEQKNTLLESDAEIIYIDDQLNLALTIDSIVEEIKTGLYADPYLLGWMTVMVSISDLVAVGAKPIGLLIVENVPDDYPPDKFSIIQKGIQDACTAAGTFILGGDTNMSSELQLTSAAIGTIKDQKLISRKGCQNSDLLMTSGKLGTGMGFAFMKLFKENSDFKYQPLPEIWKGELIREYATACIDTSDGFFPSLCNLIEINDKGFHVNLPFDRLIDDEVSEISQNYNLPDWFFLAGPHGEFEQLFTLPKTSFSAFMKKALINNWKPIKIGEVIEEKVVKYEVGHQTKIIKAFDIANLFMSVSGNHKKYLQELFEKHPPWQ